MLKRMKRKFILSNLILVAFIVSIMFILIVAVSYHDKMDEIEKALHRPVNAHNVANESGYLTATYIVVDEKGNILEMHNKRSTLDESIVDDAVAEFLLETENEMHYSEKYNAYFSFRDSKDGGYIISAITSEYVSRYMFVVVCRYLILYLGIMVAFYFIIRKNAVNVAQPIETAWNEQKRFIADVSHELKTPLAIISANSEILKARGDAKISDEIQWVNGTLKEIDHMKNLIADMMYLAKHDSFDLSIEKKMIDLSDMIAEDILQFEPVAFEAGIEFEYEVEPDIFFMCDEKEIKQLGRILMDNAAKYCPKEGSRKITASITKKKDIIISVKNTSEVISEENLERVFDRFYRGDQSRTKDSKKKGYGLGLSIAKTIVEKHGGTIKIYSGKSYGPDGMQGTEVEVRFKA